MRDHAASSSAVVAARTADDLAGALPVQPARLRLGVMKWDAWGEARPGAGLVMDALAQVLELLRGGRWVDWDWRRRLALSFAAGALLPGIAFPAEAEKASLEPYSEQPLQLLRQHAPSEIAGRLYCFSPEYPGHSQAKSEPVFDAPGTWAWKSESVLVQEVLQRRV